jgi:hypothetical protein
MPLSVSVDYDFHSLEDRVRQGYVGCIQLHPQFLASLAEASEGQGQRWGFVLDGVLADRERSRVDGWFLRGPRELQAAYLPTYYSKRRALSACRQFNPRTDVVVTSRALPLHAVTEAWLKTTFSNDVSLVMASEPLNEHQSAAYKAYVAFACQLTHFVEADLSQAALIKATLTHRYKRNVQVLLCDMQEVKAA